MSPTPPHPTDSTWSVLFEEGLDQPRRSHALQELGPVVLYACAVGLLTLLMPIAVQTLVNTVAFGTLLQPLIVLSFVVLIALAGSAVLSALSVWAVELMERRFFLRWYLEVSTRLSRLARAHRNRDELINRVFEIYATQKSIRSLLVGGLEAALTIAVGLAVLSLYHPLLAAFAVFIAAVLWVVLRLPERRGVRHALAESRAKYWLAARFEEFVLVHRVYAASPQLEREVDAGALAYLQARSEHFQVVFRQRIALWTLQAIAMASLLGAGGALVMSGQLTLGQLVASELIVSGIGLSIAKLGGYIDTAHDLIASARKLSHLRHGLNIVPDAANGTELPAHPWSVRLTHPRLVRHVDPGKVLVVSGDERVRDDLLACMLLEAQLPDIAVHYEGVEARDLRHRETRGRICFVGLDDVFSGSVFHNVSAFSAGGIDRGRARAMLERVGLDVDLDLTLVRSGEPLTRKELARLGVARAALSDASVVVIDRTLDMFDPAEAQHLANVIQGPTRVVFTDRRDLVQLLGSVESHVPSTSEAQA